MKAYGIACIVCGALWGLWVRVGERRRRRVLLSDLAAALARMGEEIRLSRRPLPELLDTLAAPCGPDASAFFHTLAAGVRDAETPSVRWRAAVDTLPLSDTDRQTLRDLAPVLRGDEAQIRNAVELAARRLEHSLRDMDRAARADFRQSAALILSAAALLVILLY